MKLVQNCLSARGDLESSFYHCRSSVEACLTGYQGRSRKQFLLRSCKAHGRLFKCRDGQMKPFYPDPAKFVQSLYKLSARGELVGRFLPQTLNL